MDHKVSILDCPTCGAKNRIKPHSENVKPICGRCKNPLFDIANDQKRSCHLFRMMVNVVLFFAISGIILAIFYTPRYLKKDYSDIVSAEKAKTAAIRLKQENYLAEVESGLKKELELVDAEKLRLEANHHYKSLYEARLSFDKQYALTPREKALLRMQELASDSTKSYHELIVSVAKEASPTGSKIRVEESPLGTALHIDFTMSSMTTGEQGTRTKHHTKDSLKKEVISLISKVTNDAFLFCREFGLSKIHVGCLHDVQTTVLGSISGTESMTLYKMVIHRDRIKVLSDNPFLDTFSTTQYLDVEEDNFSDIEIITTDTYR